jgi:two-component system nitrate/nitrite response regulator NarL
MNAPRMAAHAAHAQPKAGFDVFDQAWLIGRTAVEPLPEGLWRRRHVDPSLPPGHFHAIGAGKSPTLVSGRAMKVLIVDDHPVFRAGLTSLLEQSHPGATVLQAPDAREALALVDGHPDLDVVVLDLIMPGFAGPAAIAAFGQARPDLPVIVLSSSEKPADVREALASGALGYVAKSAGERTLISAIGMVLGGELYLPPFMLDDPGAPPVRYAAPRDDPATPLLTERQKDVLQLLGRGASNKEIARTLDLSEKTVKAHVTAVLTRLNVANRTQAAVAARERKLI